MTSLPVPDLADVLAARGRIAPYLRPTPLYRYPALDAVAAPMAARATATTIFVPEASVLGEALDQARKSEHARISSSSAS